MSQLSRDVPRQPGLENLDKAEWKLDERSSLEQRELQGERRTLIVVLQHSLIESHGYTLTISLSPLVCSVVGHTTPASSTNLEPQQTLNLDDLVSRRPCPFIAPRRITISLVVVLEGNYQWESVAS